MASKRKKILEQLVKCIKHDFGFYNPTWKWNSLPENIRDNYTIIEKDLLLWKEKGYIDLYTKNEMLYIKIFEVPTIENHQI